MIKEDALNTLLMTRGIVTVALTESVSIYPPHLQIQSYKSNILQVDSSARLLSLLLTTAE